MAEMRTDRENAFSAWASSDGGAVAAVGEAGADAAVVSVTEPNASRPGRR